MAQYLVYLYSDTALVGKRDFISFAAQQYYSILCGEAEGYTVLPVPRGRKSRYMHQHTQ